MSATCSVEHVDRRARPGMMISRPLRDSIDLLRRLFRGGSKERRVADDDCAVCNVGGRDHSYIGQATERRVVVLLFNKARRCVRHAADVRPPAAPVLHCTVDLNRVRHVRPVSRQTGVQRTRRLRYCVENTSLRCRRLPFPSLLPSFPVLPLRSSPP